MNINWKFWRKKPKLYKYDPLSEAGKAFLMGQLAYQEDHLFDSLRYMMSGLVDKKRRAEIKEKWLTQWLKWYMGMDVRKPAKKPDYRELPPAHFNCRCIPTPVMEDL